jgi:hypothetical protein
MSTRVILIILVIAFGIVARAIYLSRKRRP